MHVWTYMKGVYRTWLFSQQRAWISARPMNANNNHYAFSSWGSWNAYQYTNRLIYPINQLPKRLDPQDLYSTLYTCTVYTLTRQPTATCILSSPKSTTEHHIQTRFLHERNYSLSKLTAILRSKSRSLGCTDNDDINNETMVAEFTQNIPNDIASNVPIAQTSQNKREISETQQ